MGWTEQSMVARQSGFTSRFLIRPLGGLGAWPWSYIGTESSEARAAASLLVVDMNSAMVLTQHTWLPPWIPSEYRL